MHDRWPAPNYPTSESWSYQEDIALQQPTVSRPCSILLRVASSHSHRSGLQASASSPNVARSRWDTQGLMPTIVKPFRYWPQISAPPSGTMRSYCNPNGGCSRPASLTQASRKGRSLLSFHVTGCERWLWSFADCNSSWSRCMSWGCFKKTIENCPKHYCGGVTAGSDVRCSPRHEGPATTVIIDLKRHNPLDRWRPAI